MLKAKVGKKSVFQDYYIDFDKIAGAGYYIFGMTGSGKSMQMRVVLDEIYKHDDTEIIVINEFKNEYVTKHGINHYVDALSFNLFGMDKEVQDKLIKSYTIQGIYAERLMEFCKLALADHSFEPFNIEQAVHYFLSQIKQEEIYKTTIYDFLISLKKSGVADYNHLANLLDAHVKKRYLNYVKFGQKITVLNAANNVYNRELSLFSALCKIEEYIMKGNLNDKRLCIFIDYEIQNDLVISKIIRLARLIKQTNGILVWTANHIENTEMYKVLFLNAGIIQTFKCHQAELTKFEKLLPYKDFGYMYNFKPGESFLFYNDNQHYCKNVSMSFEHDY